MQKFEIVSETSTRVKRFNVNGRKVIFKISDVPKTEDKLGWVMDGIDAVIKYITSNVDPDDKIGFTFFSENFKEKTPGWMAFRTAKNVTFEDVWKVLGSIFQSNSEGLATDKFRLTATYVKLPRGSGSRRINPYNTYVEECTARRGVIYIDNTDNLCLLRAVVVAMAWVQKDFELYKMRKNRNKMQDQAVLLESGLEVPDTGAGINEIKILQQYLKEYKITVYIHGTKGREVLFESENNTALYKINLLYFDSHYNVITSLTAIFACSYYCEACHVPYNTKNHHRCGATCPCCQQPQPCEPKDNVSCIKCNREFRSQKCFENHQAPNSHNKETVCRVLNRCKKCLKTLNMKIKRQHTCGEIYCKLCNRFKLPQHFCYIRPNDKKPVTKSALFVFFDLETRQETKIDDNNTVAHEPNLCVFMTRCDKCINDDVAECSMCGPRTIILRQDVIHNFMFYVLELRKKFGKVVCMAHNGQAFDHQFILKYVLEKTQLNPNLIMRGTKILMLEVENVRFIDSLNYFPMALAALPKAFDLHSSLKKGFFPHLFNTRVNKNYIGPFPEAKYYSPDTMKNSDRTNFLKWYNTVKDSVFDMQKEIVEYCISDVNILTKSCLKFRQALLDKCNVCPFTEAITIASACNLVFRRNFLEPKTIGVIPRGGYRYIDNQSKIALQWLIYEEQQRNITIQHAARGKEIIIDGTHMKVDGYCQETRQIFEFYGCYYHGHDLCQPTRRNEPLHESPDDTLDPRLERTYAKTTKLRDLGFEVIEMWECDFRRLMRTNKEIKQLETYPLLNYTPLNPRDAFYGGRTGATKLYYKAKEGKKIKYVDVCSLYPWVCKYGKFPIGHPQVYVGEDCKIHNINNVNGLIKCKILPPQHIYHPVLPIKQNDKLMFVLCRICGELQYQGECTHVLEERALVGTWVADEIQKAIEKGYEILEIYEIWQYKIAQYNKNKNIGGLFAKFINKFLKMKQEASGWPSSCTSQKEKDQYIENYMNSERVQLEFAKIVKNSGLRSLAKLILNSFWGKFGQRENQPKTSIIRDPKILYDLLTDPGIDVNCIQEVNEETIIVNWEHKDEAMDLLPTVNCVIAAYVTTQARLKLYSYLEQLGERVLYYDTDSVIYIAREGEWEPPTGSFLGDMTDELEDYGVGSYITEFASGGPKMYGYTVFSTNENKVLPPTCKMKGITLNYETSKLANFDTLKDMITNNKPPVTITSRNIRRTENHDVITKTESKIMKTTFSKRKRIEEFDSVLYGYKRQRH